MHRAGIAGHEQIQLREQGGKRDQIERASDIDDRHVREV
jgi:hypothetical protein